MPVRTNMPYNAGLYFITFTCYKWLALIEQTNSYDLVYKWFDYLKTQGHEIVGYVIMPNHVHVMIDFSTSTKKLNTIIGDGKRFIAYDLIKRLKEKGEVATLSLLEKAVQSKDRANGHLHEVWKESFDWKYCETAKFAYQKLLYIHNNPCSGKWNLALDITKYEHSSARYYISGKHAVYVVKDVEEVLSKLAQQKVE
jgi:REP element-mobilizing transposase RayT